MPIHTGPYAPTIFLVAGSFILIVHLVITWVVYRTAVEHGMSAVGWALFYFFTGPIGWLVFHFARDTAGAAGSNANVRSNPGRLHEVDLRHGETDLNGMHGHLPELSGGFADQVLEELIESENWAGAADHAREMESMAGQDGNRSLAEDYVKALLWVDAKRNPFKK
jgi:hypothetical protein